MSRIGKLPIDLSDKVQATINDSQVSVKGPLGTLTLDIDSSVEVKTEDSKIVVSPKGEVTPMWGTTRSILFNMVHGVAEGFKKSLEINGVGYKFEIQGSKLILSIGFSHKVEMDIPSDLKIELDEKKKNILHITGFDKQLVGEFAAKVRSKKKPEPYKGKGIKYVGEHIVRKAGKSGK